MLLEDGYLARPVVYDSRTTSAGVDGRLVFHEGTNWFKMWFGPYTFVPSGNHTAVFIVTISHPMPLMTIDVDYGNLATVQSRVLTSADFGASGWSRFRLNFQLSKAVVDVQLRGLTS